MRIHRSYDLSDRNGFGLEAQAEEFFEVKDVCQLREATNSALPIFPIGYGTNVVLPSHVRRRVLAISLKHIRFDRVDGGWLVEVGAGVLWHELVRLSLGRGIVGLQNLALIPGLVGAAPIQNIGAYGVEFDQFVKSITVWNTLDNAIHVLSTADCRFGYRTSVFKEETGVRNIVIAVNLELGDERLNYAYPDIKPSFERLPLVHQTARELAEHVIRIRRFKLPDPRVHPNVGSVFKNPVVSVNRAESLVDQWEFSMYPHGSHAKLSAAQLIDRAGWKGHTHEGFQIWPRQPLVIVNRNRGTYQDFLDLIDMIRSNIFDRYEIELEIEPAIVK